MDRKTVFRIEARLIKMNQVQPELRPRTAAASTPHYRHLLFIYSFTKTTTAPCLIRANCTPPTLQRRNTNDASALRIPFPTARLARNALRTLSVDRELSSLVTREYSLESDTVLCVLYSASTNRMLRVSVNGFFESLGIVVHAMEELDLDVIDRPVTQRLDGVQGLEVLPTEA